MTVRFAALLAGTLACTYPKLPLLGDGGPPNDGRVPDGHLPPDGNSLDAGSDCPLLAEYSVTFFDGSGGLGAESAVDFGSSAGLTETIQWDGIISITPGAELVLQLSSGGGASTPDWPTGDVTPRSGIALSGSNEDALLAIAVDLGSGSDGLPEYGYLATSGTLNLTEISPNLVGTVTDATLVQEDDVFGGTTGPTPDPDGCETVMPSVDFNAPVSSASGSGSAAPSVGRLSAAPPAARSAPALRGRPR